VALEQDFSFFRGEDKTLRVTVPGQIMTTWELAFTVKGKYEDDTATISKTTGYGIQVVSPEVLEVAIDHTDTEGLVCGGYVYDIWRTDEGAETVLVYGNLDLLSEAL